MMKNKKYVAALSGLMVVGAAVVVSPVGASAEVAGDYEYTIVGEGVEITKYNGNGGNVAIPTELGGKPVTRIGKQAFMYKNITGVTIPNGVTYIGISAFERNNMEEIRIPDSVKTVERQAFMISTLQKIIIGTGADTIADDAFHHNVLGESVLGTIEVADGNNHYRDISGKGLYTKDGKRLIKGTRSGEIADGTEEIGQYALYNQSLTAVNIPTSVTKIGESAFDTNNLTAVIIPGNVTSIGNGALRGNKLKEINIPEAVVGIGSRAFYQNELTNVTIKNSGMTIGSGAFDYNQTTPGNLVINGFDPSTAKDHAATKGYTFNSINVEEPVRNASQTTILNLLGGDLQLDISNPVNFGVVQLGKQPKRVSQGFDDAFTVTDTRGTGLGWRLDVSATQFSEVAPVGGFSGGASTGFTLPIGSLMLNGLESIERTEGAAGGNPSIAGLSSTVIDGSSLATVSNAGLNEGAGKFALTFGTEALTLVVNSSTAKVDKVNYPTGTTPYESTITWDLVSAP